MKVNLKSLKIRGSPGVRGHSLWSWLESNLFALAHLPICIVESLRPSVSRRHARHFGIYKWEGRAAGALFTFLLRLRSSQMKPCHVQAACSLAN